jgi:hypothetical protein
MKYVFYPLYAIVKEQPRLRGKLSYCRTGLCLPDVGPHSLSASLRAKAGGRGWSRTSDLILIRDAL